MTARMANPSQRALKKRDLSPKADFVKSNTRGASTAARGTHVARAKGINTGSAASASLIDPDKPLTEKQKAFVKAWAQGESITSAAQRAGYADDGLAYRLVRMPNILALKAQYEAEWIEENQMTRKRVMDGMLESIEMAKLMSEPASMISGWREIGKICGYYAPVETRIKVDVTGNIILDRMNSMTDAELLQVIAKNQAPLLEDITDISDVSE